MSRLIMALSLLLIFSISVFTQQNHLSPDMASLVEAERAFARSSVEKGMRAAFINAFADDGINFTPHPTKTKEALSKRPAEPDNRPATLDWGPVFADVSAAGDLGYTTGPYWITQNNSEKKVVRHGFYSSIWKKQPDGQWKVVVDLGVETPELARITEVKSPASPASKPKSSVASETVESARAALISVDKEFLSALKTSEPSESYLKYLSDEARLHRNGSMPMVGREAIKSYLSKQAFSLAGEPIRSDVARSNDFGYTVGKYELKEGGSGKVEKGYYVRIWKRDGRGNWKVIFDVTSVIPPEANSGH